jgi:hypothetical protein
VTSVDHASGKLTLRTVDGRLSATFPPDAAQHVTQGDHVTQETSNSSSAAGQGSIGSSTR